MNQPKLQPSTDAEWRVYFENKCREQRKQLAAAEARCDTQLKIIKDFVGNYPGGINPWLDDAYRQGRAAIAAGGDAK